MNIGVINITLFNGRHTGWCRRACEFFNWTEGLQKGQQKGQVFA